LTYVVRRILYMIPVLLGVSVIVFILSHSIPGDPVFYYISQDDFTQEDYDEVFHMLGLDQPIYVQYWHFITDAITGDFGVSFLTKKPVLPTIIERFPNTVILALGGTLIAIIIAIPLGIIAALRRNTSMDYGSMIAALIGVSMPQFWVGIMLILIFALWIPILPPSGMGEPPEQPFLIEHAILPSITIGITMAASNARLTRSSMLEVMGKDYIRTAVAKGCQRFTVVWKHTLRNALLPVVTNISVQFAHLFGGALFVEVVFGWPGVGLLAYESIQMRDFGMLQGTVLLIAFAFVAINIIIDVLYTYLDPRITYD